MMLKRISISIAGLGLLFAIVTAPAQTSLIAEETVCAPHQGIGAPAATDGWVITYGGSDDDNLSAIQTTSDGGYVMVGNTLSFGAGNEDIWIIRLNTDGTIAWQKTYGEDGYDQPMSIVETSDGFMILARTMSFSPNLQDDDAWLLKLDFDGTVVSQKTFGGVGNDILVSLQETGDGGFIAVGETQSFGNGLNWDALIVKLKADGTVDWKTRYGSGGGDDSISSVVEMSGGGYVASGRTTSYGAGGFDIWVMKLNSDGSIGWQKTYGGVYSDEPFAMQPTKDGAVIIVGETQSYGAGSRDAWILKLDVDGNVVWQKTYGGIGEDIPFSVYETSDGSLLVAGWTYSFGRGHSDAWALKLSSDGTTIWQKTYGGVGWDWAKSIQEIDNGGILIGGETLSFGMGNTDLWLLNIGASGQIGKCPIQSNSTATESSSNAVASISEATSITASGVLTDTFTSPANTNITINRVCPMKVVYLPVIIRF